MIYWAPFLHFYQPPTQYHSVLQKICNQSYRPLIKMLLKNPKAKLTLNMCGVLTQVLVEHNAQDIIDGIATLAQRKQVEFVDSAKYHAILPLIPRKEIIRQIELNRKTNRALFKAAYRPKGFFPPEMCYSKRLAWVLAALGYEWVLVSGIAHQGEWPLDFVSQISAGSKSLKVFYRDDIVSNKISFRQMESLGFLKELSNFGKGKKNIYMITAMDAETFGHHIRHWETKFLDKTYKAIENTAGLRVATISELMKKFPFKAAQNPRQSSWSTTAEDLNQKKYYPLWKDRNNQIHTLQWQHLYLCFKLLNCALSLKDQDQQIRQHVILARDTLDQALHSCQMWWANKKRGMWNINMVNKGLLLQEEALLNAYKAIVLSSLKDEIKEDLYHQLVTAREASNAIKELLLEYRQKK